MRKVTKFLFAMVFVVTLSIAMNAGSSKAAMRSYTDKDLKYMAAIIFCEAGNQSYAGQLAVGCVIMNRVNSSAFPNTILSVIKQPGQFGPYRQGKFMREVRNVEKGLYSKSERIKSLQAAQEVLEGQRNITYRGRQYSMKKYKFFSGRLSSPKLKIGGHQFK